jgi:hypothetical protein
MSSRNTSSALGSMGQNAFPVKVWSQEPLRSIRGPILAEIPYCALQQPRVVLEMPKTCVACVAEETPHSTRLMVVVHRSRLTPADGTNPALSSKECIVCGLRQIVLAETACPDVTCLALRQVVVTFGTQPVCSLEPVWVTGCPCSPPTISVAGSAQPSAMLLSFRMALRCGHFLVPIAEVAAVTDPANGPFQWPRAGWAGDFNHQGSLRPDCQALVTKVKKVSASSMMASGVQGAREGGTRTPRR